MILFQLPSFVAWKKLDRRARLMPGVGISRRTRLRRGVTLASMQTLWTRGARDWRHALSKLIVIEGDNVQVKRFSCHQISNKPKGMIRLLELKGRMQCQSDRDSRVSERQEEQRDKICPPSSSLCSRKFSNRSAEFMQMLT